MPKISFSVAFLLLLMGAIINTSCNTTNKGGFIVSVTYKNLDKMIPQNYDDKPGDSVAVAGPIHIMLEEIPYGGDNHPVLLDSSLLNGKEGKIDLKGNGKEEGIYQIVIEKGPVVLVINDVEKINVDLDLSKKDNYYTVSGSEASEHLKSFINHYEEKAFVINSVLAQIDSLKQLGGSDSLLIAATDRKNQAIASINDYVADFIQKADSPAESIFALGMASRSFQSDEFGKMLNTVVKKFPDHKPLAQLKATYDLQQAQLNSRREASSSWTGKQAPDLALPSVDGKIVSISSFKGKYLLVDFWASWCGPCRMENPNVVNAYKQFKDKNFAILGVSLDREGEKEKWLKAIHDDQLTWTHVSDLQYWSSKAVETFKFESIPYNILIDPQGKVIAEGLRGAELENKLAEVLK
ncbi:MAG: TlpA disulfide reductase family protein [Chitinophagaceae bacterium]